MRRKTRLAALLPALWFLLAGGVVRAADDGLPRTPLNLDPAHLPAYERFPIWSYTVDSQLADGALRQLAHLINGLNLAKAWLLKLAIRSFEYAVTWRLPASFLDAVDKVVAALRNLIWEGDLSPLITAAIVATGLIALGLAVLRGRGRAAWAAVLRLFAVLVLGAMVTGAAGSWAPSLLSLTADLNTTVFTEASRVVAPADAGPSGPQVQKWALTATGDAAWRYFVLDPWAVQEFGSIEAAGRHARDGVPGAELLAQAPSARMDWYWRQTPAVREQDLGWWTEDGLPRRLAVSAGSALGTLVFTVALFVLAGGLIIQQLLVLLLTMAAPFVFLLALWPGLGELWLTRWARGLVRSLVGQTAAALLLGLLVVLTALVSSIEESMGWEMACLLLIAAAAGVAGVRRYLTVAGRRPRARDTLQPQVRRDTAAPPAREQPIPATLPPARVPASGAPSQGAAPAPRPGAGPGTASDALAQELAIQRTRALLAAEDRPVQRPAALPVHTREPLAPTYALSHRSSGAASSGPGAGAPGSGPAAEGPGRRDPREGRPAQLLAAGRKPVR